VKRQQEKGTISQTLVKLLEEDPEIPWHLEWVWRAFWRLSNKRQNGMAVNPISSEAFTAYCIRYNIRDEDVVSYLENLIDGMDAAFVDVINAKNDHDSEGTIDSDIFASSGKKSKQGSK
jgi:hypothetical protein